MAKRSARKKNKTLRLKLVFEEREIAEEENVIGSLELNEILKHFRERVDPAQKNKFEEYFFGKNEPGFHGFLA